MIKKFFYIVSVILVLLLGLLILVPYLYQDELKLMLKEELNKSLNAHVDFEDISLSLIKNFPNASLGIEGLIIKEKQDTIIGDTIISIPETDLVLDIMTVIRKDETVLVKGFHLNNPTFYLDIDENGYANYDIIKEDSTASNTNDSNAGSFDIQLEQYSISNARIQYVDIPGSMNFAAANIQHEGNGSYKGNQLFLSTESELTKTNFSMDGQPYLSDADLNGSIDLDIDLEDLKFDIDKADLKINKLATVINGWVQIFPDKYQMDLEVKAPGNEFGELWSIIPNNFKADYRNVKTDGQFSLDGTIKGAYITETGALPEVNMEIKAENGSVVYDELPQNLSAINADLSFKRPEGSPNNFIDVRHFNFKAGQSTFSAKGAISQSQMDTKIDGFVKTNLNLKDLPVDGDYSGLVNADVTFKGGANDISRKAYDRLQLDGTASLKDVIVKIAGQPDVGINSQSIQFSPNQVSAGNIDLMLGSSAVTGSMVIEEPLGFLVNDIKPRMIANLSGKEFDVDQFMSSTSGKSTDESNQLQVSSLLPFDMSLDLTAKVDDLKYDDYDIKNVDGKVTVDGQKVSIHQTNLTYANHPVSINGELDNVAQYVYSNGNLTGELKVDANTFDLNSFMSDGATEGSPPSETTVEEGTYVLPDKMNLAITTNINRVLYSNYELNNLVGSINLSEQQLDLTDLTTKAFGGKMKLIGSFLSNGVEDPTFNFKYDIAEMPFAGVYENILSIQQLAPLAKYVEGFFNSTLVVEGKLTKDLSPVLASLTASGYIETLQGELAKLPFLDKISKKLAVSSLSGLELEDTKNWFEIKDGQFIIEPFDFEYQGISINAGGSTGLDKNINLDLKLSVPREKVDKIPGGEAVGRGLDWAQNEISKLGFNLEKVDTYVFGLDVKGLITDPSIKVSMLNAKSGDSKGIIESGKDQIEQKLKDTLNQEKEKLINETKEKAEKEINKAKDSLENRINKEAEELKRKAEVEARKKAQELLDSTAAAELEKKSKEILGEGNEEKVNELKKKIEEFNPFKKKK